MDVTTDVAIIGAGTAGLAALAKVRKAGKDFVLIDGGELGTTCARVGCMPSKAAIQVAEDFHRRHRFERIGIHGRDGLRLDSAEAFEHVRDVRDIFVDRVLAGTTDDMGAAFIEAHARFVEPTVLDVDGRTVRARAVIIATGSRPLVPAAWEPFAGQILTSDDIFEQETLPGSVAAVGLGAIGVELGQALHRMGVAVTGLDRLDSICGLRDSRVAQAALEVIGKEFPLWLGHAAEVTREGAGLRVASGDRSVVVEKILASLGRVPNLDKLGIDALGVSLDARGVPAFDRHTMQVGDLPVFIAGDVTGREAILHEVAHEGRIAGVNAAGDRVRAFRRLTPLRIAFCDPNIATVGASWGDLDEAVTAVGEIRFGPVGRALIMGSNRGLLRVYAERASGKLLGACMAAPRGEHLAHLLAWAIERGLTAVDMLRVPYYHPAMEEALQAALHALVDGMGPQSPDSPELRPLIS
jgi:dihydrolipoamide dehydrogenase